MLFIHLLGRPLDARQSNGQVVAGPVDRIIRPGGVDRLEGKTFPVGELRRE
jgi:hypothetical protein